MEEEKRSEKQDLRERTRKKEEISRSKTEIILNEVSLWCVARAPGAHTHGAQQMRLFLELAFQSELDRRRPRRFGAAVVSRMINSGATANSSG